MAKYAGKGWVLQLQSFSPHDGEGVRTVVFLPGCPLRCRWCANPETWTCTPKLVYYEDKCSGCRACQGACPQGIFPGAGGGREKCRACGLCAKICPRGALRVLGQTMSVAEIVKKMQREEVFFRYSGGGVTFSGGEPLFQLPFLRRLAEELFRAGLDLWLETAGFFPWAEAADVFSFFRHVFFDLKCMDREKHLVFTGRDNVLILKNAVRLFKAGMPLTVRVPCVPDLNFTEENLQATASFMKSHLPGAAAELLPYHDLGKEKYRALGKEREFHQYRAPTAPAIEEAREFFHKNGVKTVSYN
ncbi:MAG: glycyl-radical enzyme activating protein [Acidaminococcales bacterium]|jgi:pyruvate formate lyase activating enzyme|nr:glycyl-radical enzyme activating protein [Acidaminococcales bacterium]